jgi:hypothetical protein
MRIDAIPEIHELLRTKSKKANHRRQRNAVVVTRFCEFTRMTDGKPVPALARLTVLLTRPTANGSSPINTLLPSEPKRIAQQNLDQHETPWTNPAI